MPKVSVIIPVYGAEKYLEKCLDSVVSSVLEDIEIIIIDDGSKDRCPEIADRYADKDSRISVIHKDNEGYGRACNFGLDRASGEYIAIVEPDDYIDRNMYADLYESALSENADVVKSKYIENYDIGNSSFQQIMPDMEFSFPEGVFTLKEFPVLLKLHPSIWSCIYKREFLNSNGIRFPEVAGAGWADNMFQVQTLSLARRIIGVNNAYYCWRKLFLDDSKALKDFSIPLKRSIEIRRWLAENNVTDKRISAFLFKRELAYLKTTHKVLKLSEISAYKNLLYKYFQTADTDYIVQFPDIACKERSLYSLLKNFTGSVIIKDKIKFFISNIIKFRFGKKKKYLYIGEHCIFR